MAPLPSLPPAGPQSVQAQTAKWSCFSWRRRRQGSESLTDVKGAEENRRTGPKFGNDGAARLRRPPAGPGASPARGRGGLGERDVGYGASQMPGQHQNQVFTQLAFIQGSK
ncbi:uncharacterized protein PS065_012120 [Dugong dugon]